MIACRNLTRRYGPSTVVDGLDIDLPQGSVCAFLGPNGAGKSTTVKLLTGQLRPDSGEATVAGWDVLRRPLELKRCIGVLPDRLGLFDHLTVEEHLHMAGPIYGLSKAETGERASQLMHMLGLGLLQVFPLALTGTLVHRNSHWFVLPCLGLYLGTLAYFGKRLEQA